MSPEQVVDDNRIEAYWQSYLATLPADSPVRDERPVAEGWGDSAGGWRTSWES